jgi:glycosyltransferase involved in cell wall biosynthesis
MPERRFRVLAIATHPVQYSAPLFRRMATSPHLDFHVAYCSLRGAEPGHDPDFGTVLKWDVPLLDGYEWTHVANRGSGEESFLGLRNTDLWKLIRSRNFDAILCYVGYVQLSFWIAYFAAKSSRTSFLFGTDSTTLAPRDLRSWKTAFKRIFWPRLFRLADQVIVPSSGTRELMLSLGIADERITLTPYTVDNEWWMQRSGQIDRESVRGPWGASASDAVILFCAKLQPWKRPLDLLRAFAKLNLLSSRLVFAGDGPLRQQLEAEAAALGVAARVHFLGFVNQSQLPAVYKSADLMVLPSEYEPFAVVVNEAMCCGCPVIASDHVGAARDLIAPVCPEFIFACGDVDALAALLKKAVADPARLQALGERGAAHMQTWSPERNIDATIQAIEIAVSRKRDLRDPGLPRSRWPDAALSLWIVAAQVWYYLQFREQFRAIFSLTLHKLWR